MQLTDSDMENFSDNKTADAGQKDSRIAKYLLIVHDMAIDMLRLSTEMDAYVPKPIDFRHMLKTLSHYSGGIR